MLGRVLCLHLRGCLREEESTPWLPDWCLRLEGLLLLVMVLEMLIANLLLMLQLLLLHKKHVWHRASKLALLLKPLHWYRLLLRVLLVTHLESCKLLLHADPEVMLHHLFRSHEVPLTLRIPLIHLLHIIVVLLLLLLIRRVWKLLRERCDGLCFLKLGWLSTQLRIHPFHLALMVLMHSILRLSSIYYRLRWLLLLLLLLLLVLL